MDLSNEEKRGDQENKLSQPGRSMLGKKSCFTVLLMLCLCLHRM